MNFDLNIQKYSQGELLDMFELPTNFTKEMVEIKVSKFKKNILNDKKIQSELKNQIMDFITKAKNKIISETKQFQEVYNTNYKLQPIDLENSQQHMVQQRENRPFTSSFPSEFYPGVINPLKKRTIFTNLNIDSRFRDNYYTTSSSNYNVNLPLNIDNVLQIQLNAIEMPSTYYAISKQYGNNFFTITVTTDADIQTKVIDIPSGNYTATSIMDIINTRLTSYGEPFNSVCFVVNFITDEKTGTGQTMVGPTTNPSAENIIDIELNFQNDKNGYEDHNTPLPLKLGWILGFRNGVYTGNVNYVSEGVVEVTGPKYVYLVVDDYNNNVNNGFYSAFNSSLLNKNIIARISLQGNSSNIIEKNNLNIVATPRQYFGPVNLQIMNIQLLDEYGRIVDLNNMDFSFCLLLSVVYDL
jgi:hypothetical protein